MRRLPCELNTFLGDTAMSIDAIAGLSRRTCLVFICKRGLHLYDYKSELAC